jgi:hypothetical protein
LIVSLIAVELATKWSSVEIDCPISDQRATAGVVLAASVVV